MIFVVVSVKRLSRVFTSVYFCSLTSPYLFYLEWYWLFLAISNFPHKCLNRFFILHKNRCLNFFFYFLTLQYCIGFAIYQRESATGIHVFPILNPPPSSIPVPSLWVVGVHQPQASTSVWDECNCVPYLKSKDCIC